METSGVSNVDHAEPGTHSPAPDQTHTIPVIRILERYYDNTKLSSLFEEIQNKLNQVDFSNDAESAVTSVYNAFLPIKRELEQILSPEDYQWFVNDYVNVVPGNNREVVRTFFMTRVNTSGGAVTGQTGGDDGLEILLLVGQLGLWGGAVALYTCFAIGISLFRCSRAAGIFVGNYSQNPAYAHKAARKEMQRLGDFVLNTPAEWIEKLTFIGKKNDDTSGSASETSSSPPTGTVGGGGRSSSRRSLIRRKTFRLDRKKAKKRTSTTRHRLSHRGHGRRQVSALVTQQ